MKRYTCLIVICFLMLTIIPALAGNSDFTIDADGVLTKYTGSDTTVVIPDSVTAIGANAFSGNMIITNLIIPKSVISIGESAFENCQNLESVSISDGLLSIGEKAFLECRKLHTITLPKTLYSIGIDAFGVSVNLESIVLPEGLTTIGRGAFYSSGIYDVTIPDSVISIGTSAFDTTVTINASRESYAADWAIADKRKIHFIGDGDFTIVGNTLYSYVGSDTEVIVSSDIEKIAGAAFAGCKELKSVEIPSSVTSIDNDAFRKCQNLENVILNEGLLSIAPWVFVDCYKLDKIFIPESVIYVGDKAIESYTSIYAYADSYAAQWAIENNRTVYYLGESTPTLSDFEIDTDGVLTKYTGSDTTVVIPDSVTSIGYEAFYNCYSLTSVTIPDSVTSIGNRAFYNCSSLTSVTIPDSVTSIGDNAFLNCSSLTTVSVNIPEGVTSIANSRFSGWSFVTDITIPDSVTSIGNSAFYGCSSLTSINIPDSVTSIGDGAFASCSSLTSITIPDSVTSFGNYAFSRCSSLTSINIPDSVTSLGEAVLSGCSSLENVIIPDSVTSIGDYTFDDCISLTSVIIPDSVISIGHQAFSDCSNLISITIPDSVKSIGNHAFSMCGSLQNVTIPNSVISIDDYAFSGCSSLIKVDISYGLKTIGRGSFEGCSNLIEISIPESVTSIGEVAFKNCSSLKRMEIPDSITIIQGGTFSGCSDLNSLIIPNTVTSLGETRYARNQGTISDGTFYGCTSLTSINLPDGINYIGYYTFYGCSNLTEITIPNTVTSIGNEAFNGCASLEQITLPNRLTSIGEKAFYGCSSLSAISIPDSVTSINISTFRDCTGLAYVEISDSVTSIGDYAFNNCSSLMNIIIPEKVTSIGNRAFQNCSNITELTIPACVTRIFPKAFHQDTQLHTYCGSYGEQWAEDNGYTYSVICERVQPDSLEITGVKYVVVGNTIGLGVRYHQDPQPTNKKVTWLSGDETIAGVNDDGIVTGAAIGKTEISACSVDNPSVCASFEMNVLETFDFEIDTDGVLIGYTGSDENVVIPDGVTAIGNRVFYYNYSVKSIKIPDSVTLIGDNAFDNCINLASINLPASIKKGGYEMFGSCDSLTSAGPLGSGSCIEFGWTEELPKNAFYGAYQVKAVTIPEGITKIGNSALKNLYSLEEINLPSSLEIIGDEAFANSYYRSYGDSNKSLVLPDGLVTIGNSAFSGASRLGKITIPASVTSIGDFAINSNTTIYTYQDSYAAQWADTNGRNLRLLDFPFEIQDDVLVSYYGTEENVVIPEGVVTIGDSAFNGNTTVTGVVIPDSVTSIEAEAFAGCTALANLKIPASVTSIGNRAFSGDEKLESITLPDGLESLGEGAFKNCTGLSEIVIPGKINMISQDLLSGCSNLRKIVILGSVNSFGSGSFENCNIEDITAPVSFFSAISTLIDYGYNFFPTEKIKTAALTDAITAIPDKLFSNYSALESFDIPQTVTSIGNSAFSGCTGLAAITIPDGVTSIGANAFDGCGSLTNIDLSGNITSIGGYAFRRTGLTDVAIPSGVKSLSNSLFEGCSDLSSVEIPDGVETIGLNAFNNCPSLESIAVPVSVISIDTDAISAAMSGTWGSAAYTYAKSNGLEWTSTSYPEDYIPAESIEISGPDAIPSGISASYSVTISPSDASEKGVIWTSSDESVAVVTSSLSSNQNTVTVTAYDVSDYTKVKLTAASIEDELVFGEKEITVYPSELGITIMDGDEPLHGWSVLEFDLNSDEPIHQLSFKAEPDLPVEIVWSSGDESIAAVDETGLVRGIGPGETVIMAKDRRSGVTTSVIVSVHRYVNGISFTGPESVVGGRSFTIYAEVRPEQVDHPILTWSVSDNSVGRIADTGLLERDGKTLEYCFIRTYLIDENVPFCVSARADDNGGHIAEYQMTILPASSIVDPTVPPQITSIIILDMETGPLGGTGLIDMAKTASHTYQLDAEVEPAEAKKNVDWLSSDPKIASVDSTGKVTALKNGTVTITAEAKDGSRVVSAPFTITAEVLPQPGSITVKGKQSEILTGRTLSLTAKIAGSPTKKTVVWRSTEPDVAGVSEKGLVTGLSYGSTVIMACHVTNRDICAEYPVNVNESTGSIVISGEDGADYKVFDLNSGELTWQLDAEIMPGHASQDLTWKSSSPAVASVDSTGFITAKKAGTAKITASASDGTKVVSNTFTVTAAVLPHAGDLTINGKVSEILQGKTASLTAVFSGKPSNKTVLWESSDESVAAVTPKGVVTGKGGGKVDIIARSAINPDEVYDVYPMTVIPLASSVTVSSEDDPVIDVGTSGTDAARLTIQMNAAVEPAAAGQAVTWKSSSTGVAAVDRNGVVTGKKPGTAKITASASDGSKKVSNEFIVTVVSKPYSLTVSGKANEVQEGKTLALKAAFTQKVQPTDKTILWSSDNERIATVDAKGVVKGISYGKAMITAVSAADPSAQDTFEVTVTGLTKELSIEQGNSLTMETGGTQTLTVRVNEGGSDAVTWTSSAPKVVSVQDGVVTALKAGTAKITAKSKANSKLSAVITITVESAGAGQSDEIPAAAYEAAAGGNAAETGSMPDAIETAENVPEAEIPETSALRFTNGDIYLAAGERDRKSVV